MFSFNVFADTTVTPEREYEIWTQSPYLTCGLTDEDVRIYKAYELNALEMIPLTELGDRYYLAACQDKNKDGGYNGKTETSELYFYVVYLTDNGFITLSYSYASNEYYWDRGYALSNIANQINTSYYSSNSSEVPLYILNPCGKYTNLNIDEYDEYFFITDSGKIYHTDDDAENGTEGYPYIKDGILYRGQNKYYKSSRYYYYYMSDESTRASNSTPILFKNSTLTFGTEIRVPVDDMTAANGYNLYTDGSIIAMTPYYSLIPGTSLYYYTTEYIAEYNSTDQVFYYNIKVNTYKKMNKYMDLQETFIIPTRNTKVTAFTCRTLTSLDSSYYSNGGYAIPKVAIGDYGIITSTRKVFAITLDPSIYTKNFHIGGYNKHLAIVRSYTGNSYINHTNPATGSSCYWQVINEITFDTNGNMSMTADLELPISSSANTGQNGYFSTYSQWKDPSFGKISATALTTWFGRKFSNVFPDGRYVEADWMGMGSGLEEIWYKIYNSDDSLRATGPTGYSKYFSSVFDLYDLLTFTTNNTKFLTCIGDVGNSFVKEYYRVAVVSESEDGEVSGKVEIGEKSITPPSGSDTEVVQSTIDFTQNELPIGYNIKNNVIGSGKLDADLREQVNAIRLNDIVILKKAGYVSGEQNTGVTLSSYSSYDYSLGSSYVRFYSNGQYFRWYCNYPENLTVGVYDKTFTVGDKKVYVTIKVIQPPTNSGSTTVVF